MRQFVRAVIVRISVTPERIVIALNKRVLRCALLPAATHSASAASRDDEDELLQLTIEARLQRRGREVRLVVSPRAGAPSGGAGRPSADGAARTRAPLA